MYIFIDMFLYAYIYVCVCVCICICACACVYIYVYLMNIMAAFSLLNMLDWIGRTRSVSGWVYDNERAQSLKPIEYYSKKEIISSGFCDYRLSCLSLEYDHTHAENGIRVVKAFAT